MKEWDPTGKVGPRVPLPDVVTVLAPKVCALWLCVLRAVCARRGAAERRAGAAFGASLSALGRAGVKGRCVAAHLWPHRAARHAKCSHVPQLSTTHPSRPQEEEYVSDKAEKLKAAV